MTGKTKTKKTETTDPVTPYEPTSVEVVIRLSGQPLVVLKLEPYRLISVYVGGTSE